MKKLCYLFGLLALTACAGSGGNYEYVEPITPTVDFVEQLDVYSAPHKDSFLNRLAMNYRSYAVFNARNSGFPDVGEQFAQKAVAAFSGETPYPESVDAWPVADVEQRMDLQAACRELLDALRNDAADIEPELTAEAQAKFDCWLSASSTCQTRTAAECRARFHTAMNALMANLSGANNRIISRTSEILISETPAAAQHGYYPETATLSSMTDTTRAREGIVIVNNVNIPQNLIQPVSAHSAHPVVFNQNITHHGNGRITTNDECVGEDCDDEIPMIGEEVVSREEFINMMVALRSELAAINKRLDARDSDLTILKVQQIPLEPKQHVMEEVFEVRFDFDKANIKPEYESVIKKLVETTRANRNVKITVVGHTDTVGTADYNYALGGARAESVRKMLVKYGIPSEQIVAVSSGKTDPKVPTGDGVANAENRRARVVKETHYVEPAMSGAGIGASVISISNSDKSDGLKKPEPLAEITEINITETEIVE